jgi:hypothetical protein
MRGFVYRQGRRRAGSVLVALGVAATLALGSVTAAVAKAPAVVSSVHAYVVGPTHVALVTSVRAPVKPVVAAPVKPVVVAPAKPAPVAHAAGHKIA